MPLRTHLASLATNAWNTNTAQSPLADIHDIQPPVLIRSPAEMLLWALAAVALIALIWWLVRRWLRSRSKPSLAVPVSPPHIRALQQLERALRLISDAQPFCFEVSSILRGYLEASLGLRAPERTTEEFLLEVQASETLSAEQKHILGDFLVRCDLVKFARDEPAENDLRHLHAAAVRLVVETSPPSKLPPASAPAMP
jgi:hypothetical protein